MTDRERLFARATAIGIFVSVGVVASLMGDLLGSRLSDKSAGCIAFVIVGLYLVFDLTRKEQDEDSARGPDDPTFGNGG
jgi:pilus assembly protein TadC